jgi:hypothetical protein
MTLFEGNLPQNDRERERQKRKEKKESERVGCQMIWQVPETEHHRLNFPHRFCPFCERTWFTPSLYNELSCMVPGYRFLGGPIALQSFVHISDKKTPAIPKWSSTILTVTHVDSMMVDCTSLYHLYLLGAMKAFTC